MEKVKLLKTDYNIKLGNIDYDAKYIFEFGYNVEGTEMVQHLV